MSPELRKEIHWALSLLSERLTEERYAIERNAKGPSAFIGEAIRNQQRAHSVLEAFYPSKKECSVCKETKPTWEFYYHETRDRYDSRCKQCRKLVEATKYRGGILLKRRADALQDKK